MAKPARPEWGQNRFSAAHFLASSSNVVVFVLESSAIRPTNRTVGWMACSTCTRHVPASTLVTKNNNNNEQRKHDWKQCPSQLNNGWDVREMGPRTRAHYSFLRCGCGWVWVDVGGCGWFLRSFEPTARKYVRVCVWMCIRHQSCGKLQNVGRKHYSWGKHARKTHPAELRRFNIIVFAMQSVPNGAVTYIYIIYNLYIWSKQKKNTAKHEGFFLLYLLKCKPSNSLKAIFKNCVYTHKTQLFVVVQFMCVGSTRGVCVCGVLFSWFNVKTPSPLICCKMQNNLNCVCHNSWLLAHVKPTHFTIFTLIHQVRLLRIENSIVYLWPVEKVSSLA